MAYCDEMTRDIRVRDATFAAVRQAFDDKDIVEITATVAAYNMVSRFLEAIRIDHE
jgi:alkylhydroperoxidase family enzyme